MSPFPSLGRKVTGAPTLTPAAEGKPDASAAHDQSSRRGARSPSRRSRLRRIGTAAGSRVGRVWGPVWRITRPLRRLVAALLVVAVITSAIGLARSRPVRVASAPERATVVVDVTQIDPIAVATVVRPRTTEEVAAAVRASRGPLSVGGGRYSMGGQTATPGGTQLDLRALRGVVAFAPNERTITVRAGTTWREVQQAIDGAGLAVKVMQTYNTFTVGGALSVNAHGRYIGNGPVIGSVRAIRLVLADGRVVDASRSENPELFFGAIGGYGGIGVITEATLDLVPNVKVRRDDESMPIADYHTYFARRIASDSTVVFHNADIYPPAYERVHAVSYRRTSEPLTVADRMLPADQSSATHRLAYSLISGSAAGPWIREHVIDPLLFRGHPVTWRNYEASYDVSELEPASRDRSTYVLQEYFIPVDSFAAFVPRMRRVLQTHHVNAVNVSIRHAEADRGSLLGWAPTETYAFVLYYRQGTDPTSRHAVGRWTRAMDEAAIASGGRWYLPYQPHATRDQFLRAYPRAADYFALKRRVDPSGRLTNTLWDLYAPAPNGGEPLAVTASRLPAQLPGEVRARLDTMPAYQRDESAALLTHPEWDLVYTSDAYAAWLAAGKRPSGFPYTATVGTFWRSYWATYRAARRTYDVPLGLHVMLGVIGTSTAVEYGLKAAYENTIGRLSELAMPRGGTAEDRYAARVAADYGRLIHDRGWYEFCFSCALAGLWQDVTLHGAGMPRKIERRAILSAEYAIKAVYATLIGLGTRAGYDPDAKTRGLVVVGWSDALAAREPALRAIGRGVPLGRGYTLVELPRYDAYGAALVALGRHAPEVRIAEASGCDVITAVATVPAGWRAPAAARAVVAYADPAATARTRVLLRVPVRDLLDVLGAMGRDRRVRIEHVYDY
ncbi:MAG: FAD-binding oxidoreductase [Gemmatirosa sp.]|nr:FAD-binding oxidoreductase [Gemmatirosa sp.]